MALAVALIYFVVIIVISVIQSRKNVKSSDDFTKAGGGMNWLLVTFSFVLVPLGSGHTLSLWQTATSGIGASAVWWAIGAGAIFLPLMMLWFGPWVKDTRLGTMPEIIERMFGRGLGSLHAAFQTMTWTGIGISETIATGTAIFGLTGGNLNKNYCIIIGIVLMLVYVLFGGVLQMAFLNVINSIVLLVGSYTALGFLGIYLAGNAAGWDGAGWAMIQDIYNNVGTQAEMGLTAIRDFLITDQGLGIGQYLVGGQLSNFQLGNSALWFEVILPVVVLHTTAGVVSQCMNTPFFAAKDNHACRKGVFLGCGLNIVSCIPWVVMSLVGMALPKVLEAAATNPNVKDATADIVPLLAIEALPAPIVGLMMVSLLAACLSTGGSILMGNGMVIASDVIKRPWKPNMSDKSFMVLLRVCIVIMALILVIGALNMTVVFPVFLWCFSFGIPVFVVYFLGQIWKISRPAAWITILASYVVGIIWTFPDTLGYSLPSWATGPLSLNMYVCSIVSVVLGVVLTAILPGTPGLRTKKYQEMHPEFAFERT